MGNPPTAPTIEYLRTIEDISLYGSAHPVWNDEAMEETLTNTSPSYVWFGTDGDTTEYFQEAGAGHDFVIPEGDEAKSGCAQLLTLLLHMSLSCHSAISGMKCLTGDSMTRNHSTSEQPYVERSKTARFEGGNQQLITERIFGETGLEMREQPQSDYPRCGMVEETLIQGQGATYMHYQKGHSGPSSITRDVMMMTQVLFRNIVAESEAELEELGDTYPLNAKYVVIPNNLSDAKDFIRNEPIRSFLLDRGNDRIEEVVGVPARSAMAKKNYHKALALEEQILLVNAQWSNQLQSQNPVKGPLPNFVQNAPEGVKIN